MISSEEIILYKRQVIILRVLFCLIMLAFFLVLVIPEIIAFINLGEVVKHFITRVDSLPTPNFFVCGPRASVNSLVIEVLDLNSKALNKELGTKYSKYTRTVSGSSLVNQGDWISDQCLLFEPPKEEFLFRSDESKYRIIISVTGSERVASLLYGIYDGALDASIQPLIVSTPSVTQFAFERHGNGFLNKRIPWPRPGFEIR